MSSGPLALVGGGEFTDGCSFDRDLVEAADGAPVLILPTGAAYEHPDRLVGRAVDWFKGLGAEALGLDVLRRPDAFDDANISAVRDAKFVYLVGDSPMHVRSVLKDTPLWQALLDGWSQGAVLAGSVAGAMVLCDPMVDPRGGAFTLGLGALTGVTVIPEFDKWSEDAVQRTRKLCPADLHLVGIPTETALIRDSSGKWEASGASEVTVYREGEIVELAELNAI